MTSKRDISATNETGFNQALVKMVFFARLDFSSGVKRFHTEIGPKTVTHPVHGSESYDGLGDFGGISKEVKESTAGKPIGVVIGLTGVDSALINDAFTDDYFRREGSIMIGLEDASGAMLDDPEVLFEGYMDKMEIAFVKGKANIAMSLESRGTNLLTSSDWRFTDEDKQREVTGDLFGEYIYRMADLQLKWGSNQVFSTGIGGSVHSGAAGGGREGPPPQKQ
jgi:hypothetical protein